MFKQHLCRFFRDSHGSMAIAGALCLTPLILMTVAQIQITKSMAVQTRMHQAQISSVLAVAKEGENVGEDERIRLADAYMQQNIAVLRANTPPSLELAGGRDMDELSASIQTKPLAEKLLGGIFDAPQTDSVRSERFYRPIEVVVIMDSSVSMRSQHAMLLEAAEKITESIFRGESSANDVRMSLVAYSDWVNVGREFADKLVLPESRELNMPPFIPYTGPDPGPEPAPLPPNPTVAQRIARSKAMSAWNALVAASQTNKKVYDAGQARKETLEYYNPSLVHDLLAPNGPGDDAHEVMCLARKPLPAGSSSPAIQKYVDNIDLPPSGLADGFNLIMADDRTFTEAKVITTQTQPGSFFSYAYYGFSESNFLDAAKIPKSALNGRSDIQLTTSASTYDSKYGTNISGSSSKSVSVPLGCPPMPMLVGAQTVAEVMERLELFGGSWSTGGDEGIAWAMRLLSPNWSEIWERGDDYPAPYHSTTEKRILYLAGSLTEGYFDNPNAHKIMCEKLIENGIDLYIVINAEKTVNAKSVTLYKGCVPEEQLYEAKKSSAVPEVMAEMARRQYHIRLTN